MRIPSNVQTKKLRAETSAELFKSEMYASGVCPLTNERERTLALSTSDLTGLFLAAGIVFSLAVAVSFIEKGWNKEKDETTEKSERPNEQDGEPSLETYTDSLIERATDSSAVDGDELKYATLLRLLEDLLDAHEHLRRETVAERDRRPRGGVFGIPPELFARTGRGSLVSHASSDPEMGPSELEQGFPDALSRNPKSYDRRSGNVRYT